MKILNIKKNFVSVIIPVYNRSKCLVKAVESCLSQTHPNVEVIIVDDGSNDSTPDVISSLINKWGTERIKRIRQNNQGACVARNNGIDMARGEYIQFLDSDDYILPEKFSKQIDALQKSQYPIAVCDFQYVSEEENYRVIKTILNTGNLHKKIACFKSISIFTPLFRANSIPNNLRFNPNIKVAQDIDFMLRYFIGIQGWVYTPGIWCQYVMHQENRITDTYSQGIPYSDLFNSLYIYWSNNRSVIPQTNNWIVNEFALTMSQGIYYHEDPARARLLAFFALKPPLDLKRFFRSFLLIAKTFAPEFVLKIWRNYLINKKDNP